MGGHISGGAKKLGGNIAKEFKKAQGNAKKEWEKLRKQLTNEAKGLAAATCAVQLTPIAAKLVALACPKIIMAFPTACEPTNYAATSGTLAASACIRAAQEL